MSCQYYSLTRDTCGLVDSASDFFDPITDPTGCLINTMACVDPENTNCSHYEEEDD